jgi:hypothetical protein
MISLAALVLVWFFLPVLAYSIMNCEFSDIEYMEKLRVMKSQDH